MNRWKLAAGGVTVPAQYTPDDPLDLQGKQPLFDAMDTQWWNLPPEQGERAVVNAFRATMLSPRMNLKGNAVLYQSLMNVDPNESDPNVFENIIRQLKSSWDEQGQTPLEGDPDDVMAVDQILPGKFQPGIWTNIRRIAALGPYASELYKAALTDIEQYGGSGQYFRNRILQLNIPGIKAKVASFAWLALAPNQSELGTIDVHMMRHLGEDADSPRNTTHYLQLEDQLRQERDDTYPGVPLSKYQWGVWDKRRTPGFHQDHSPLRPVDPTPYTDVYWAPQPRPPRPQRLPEMNPDQMQLAKSKWSMRGYPDAQSAFEIFVGDVIRAMGLTRVDHDTNVMIHNKLLELTRGETPNMGRNEFSRMDSKDYRKGVENVTRQLAQDQDLQTLIQMSQIPNLDVRQDDLNQNWNGVRPQVAKWTMIRLVDSSNIRTAGYTLRGQIVGAAPQTATQGVAIRMDMGRDAILQTLEQLPTHAQDYEKQRNLIPEWALNRGGKVADIRPAPDGSGATYGAGAIVVAEWVDVNDNWLLYHDAVIGIVAGKGGATSHGVVVARERNIPIVVNVEGWDVIKEGDTLSLDAKSGLIEVNGGGAGQETGEAQVAEEPVIAFVWSMGRGMYQPIPQGSGGSVALHREMMKEMKQQGTFSKQDYAIGVVYADGHTQQQGTPTDQAALTQWLNTILPAQAPTA